MIPWVILLGDKTKQEKGERNMASAHFKVPGCFWGHSQGRKRCKETLIQIPDTPLSRLGLGLPISTTASDLHPLEAPPR